MITRDTPGVSRVIMECRSTAAAGRGYCLTVSSSFSVSSSMRSPVQRSIA
jgi:hypothetical protein